MAQLYSDLVRAEDYLRMEAERDRLLADNKAMRAVLEDGATRARVLTWVVAMLAEDYDKPQVGDWVVEKSHLVGVRKCQALPSAIGKIKEIADYSCYTIECMDGVEQRWENAMMVKIPSLDATLAKAK